MLVIKTQRELQLMREAGRIAATALKKAGDMVKPGVSTEEIDLKIFNYISSEGATPSFLNYNGFPASACISVNNEVIHGIPSSRRILKQGDIVSIDVGANYNGFHGDNAATFACGNISEKAKKLIDTTKASLLKAIEKARPGFRVNDIGQEVQKYVESEGFSVVRDFVGHGVGLNLHEDPEVPNFKTRCRGLKLVPGMTLAIEPMVNEGSSDVKILQDGWTTVTADGKLSAHFEFTVAITEKDPIILTDPSFKEE